MSRFGPAPRAFFDAVYQGDAPWDVGSAQPALLTLFRAHPPAGPVLDVGCGSGDLAIALAGEGLEVLGVDFSEAAIQQARDRAAAPGRGVAGSLRFEVADALRPSLLRRRFGAVVDSGFLHLFDPPEAARFVDELAAVLVPGGRYYLLAFATDFGGPNMPRAVTDAELRGWFTAERGWRVLEMDPAHFQSRVAPVPAVAACFERLPRAHSLETPATEAER